MAFGDYHLTLPVLERLKFGEHNEGALKFPRELALQILFYQFLKMIKEEVDDYE